VLGAALWFVVALGLLAAVVLDGAAAFGRAAVQAAADHALEGAMHDAVADYQNRLASAIAQTAAPLSPAQPFTGAAPALGGYANALAALPNPLQGTFGSTVTYTVTPTTIAPPNCAPPGRTPAQPDAIGWLQCSGMVQESRMSLHVVVRALAAGGEMLAERDAFVTLRLFAEPPYSAPVGNGDAAADAPAGADALVAPAHEGDVGGSTVAGIAPPAAASAPPAGGTSIHVQYECHDGAGHCANATPPDPDAALQAGSSWSNGNRPQP
jgi:hypothetical protein